MPLECNACHTYPGLANNAGSHRMSAVHDIHVGVPLGDPATPNKA